MGNCLSSSDKEVAIPGVQDSPPTAPNNVPDQPLINPVDVKRDNKEEPEMLEGTSVMSNNDVAKVDDVVVNEPQSAPVEPEPVHVSSSPDPAPAIIDEPAVAAEPVPEPVAAPEPVEAPATMTDEPVAAVPAVAAVVPDQPSPAEAPAAVEPPSSTSHHMPKLKQGFVNKEGQFLRNWNIRYFVLDNGDLSYYEKPHNIPPYGIGKKGSGKTLVDAGELMTKIKGGEARDILLKFTDKVNQDEWTIALQEHIDYCNKTS